MTQRWLCCQTPNTPRTPIFYTLTKIHKPIPVGRPIISGCEGPTERLSSFVAKLLERGYPGNFIKKTLSEVNFEDRGRALLQNEKENKRISHFVTQYQPSVPNLKQILLDKWHLIEQNPALKEIYTGKPLISYRKGRFLKDILVRAKLR